MELRAVLGNPRRRRWFPGGEGYEPFPGLALALADIFKNSVRIMIELDRIFFSKLASFFHYRILPHYFSLP